MRKKINNVANYISLLRMALSLSSLMLWSNKTAFIIVYLVCGLSDVVDGYIARRTNSESKLGEKLDSIADFVMFFVIAMILYESLKSQISSIIIPLTIALVIRFTAYLVSLIKYHSLVFLHTILNKITGLSVFLSPLIVMKYIDIRGIYFILGIAGLAAIEEVAIHITTREADANRKSIFPFVGK